MEVVTYFQYLGKCFSKDGELPDDVKIRMDEGQTTFSTFEAMFNVRSVSLSVKKQLLEGAAIPMVM